MSNDYQQFWNEYWLTGSQKYPALNNVLDTPRPIRLLLEYFQANQIQPDNWQILDLFAGLGRNSFALLQQPGFAKSTLIDFAPQAMDLSLKLADNFDLISKVKYINQGFEKPLGVADGSIDLVLDIYGSMTARVETRLLVKNEIMRVLRPGGLALVYLISSVSEFVQRKIDIIDGPEPGSYYMADNHQFEKSFTKEEIREFYQDFNILDCKAVAYESEYKFEMFWVLIQKN